jgi:hypothetical protein
MKKIEDNNTLVFLVSFGWLGNKLGSNVFELIREARAAATGGASHWWGQCPAVFYCSVSYRIPESLISH